jgi:arylsulfatase A-like enzyme
MPENPAEQTVDNYTDNLLYLDRVIGEVVDALKKAGKYESSMLILTSDHGWRHDPERTYADLPREDQDPRSELRHVPLIVKFPHQSTPGEVKTPLTTTELHLIIRRALEAARNSEGAT